MILQDDYSSEDLERLWQAGTLKQRVYAVIDRLFLTSTGIEARIATFSSSAGGSDPAQEPENLFSRPDALPCSAGRKTSSKTAMASTVGAAGRWNEP